MANNKRDPADSPGQQAQPPGIGVAVVVPWIAFWGWVALDSALAYRKSQAALEQGAETSNAPNAVDEPQAQTAKLEWTEQTIERLQGVRKLARISMIGAPIVAVLGSLALGRLRSKSKPSPPNPSDD